MSRHRVHAAPSASDHDVWDADWDGNDDGLRVYDTYHKMGRARGLAYLIDNVDTDTKTSNNELRASIHLLVLNHGNQVELNVLKNALAGMNYLMNDEAWLKIVSGYGNARDLLHKELEALKAVMRTNHSHLAFAGLDAVASELRAHGLQVSVVVPHA